MRNKYKLRNLILSISFFSFNKTNILGRNISQTSILNNKNTLHKGGVRTLEVEANNQEEDFVKEEAKLYAIIVASQENLPKIVKVLQKIVHIIKHLITL